jgi:UDP-glucose 4-epimerase
VKARPARHGRQTASTAARAIVTGGAGFVGSHLVERLARDGTSVLVVDDLSTGRAENLPEDISLERFDIATGDLEALFRAWRPGVVFHLAAQASVPQSIKDPLRDLSVNVIGTHRVAMAARDAQAERLVFVSSGGAIYGESARPATELARPTPSSYYGVHKLAAEGHVSLSGIPFAIARPSNIYGPIQTGGLDGAVVAAFVESATSSGRVRIHGDGSQTRDFVDVRDAVEALIHLARPETPEGIWNVASGRRVSIANLADLVEAALGREIIREYSPRRPGDVRHSAVSAGRLRRLGWRPVRDLASGVRELIGRPAD